ncbi:MAG: FAD-binding oxidoreductase [Polyangiaceae bacterium]
MGRRSWWGWGREGAGLSDERRRRLGMLLGTQIDTSGLVAMAPPALGDVSLPKCRLTKPLSWLSDDPFDRAGHTYGKAFRDVVRALGGDLSVAPDLVATPADEEQLVQTLDWADEHGYAVIPYGGGSSVVGGVEARCRDEFPGVISLDLGGLGGVREIDRTSRAARIGAGTLGPDLEKELARHDLTLRHFPQSFEFSTVGGWIATRAGGHFATLYTHIDDFVQSLTVVTPAGKIETRRLPGSGAGPSPDRLFLGSEGALGIITEAWLRLQDRPRHRASASFAFADFYAAGEAARLLAQSGLFPANCRILDPIEALINGIGDGATTFLLVGFESADHPVDAWLSRAETIAAGAGGASTASRPTSAALPSADIVEGDGDGAAGRWKKMFLRGPYLRDALVEMGMIVETFETAITWDRFEGFHRTVKETAERMVTSICGGGVVSSRVTHVYPDGAAPYFTVIAPAKAGSQVRQWDDIKAAVSQALIDGGGTITHHHAVGRDHRPWYD